MTIKYTSEYQAYIDIEKTSRVEFRYFAYYLNIISHGLKKVKFNFRLKQKWFVNYFNSPSMNKILFIPKVI